MNQKQKNILILWAIVAVLILLFPHWITRGGGATRGAGWAFIGSKEVGGYRHPTIDVGLLVVFELVAAGIFGVPLWEVGKEDREKDKSPADTP
jgi:hypothetical protein